MKVLLDTCVWGGAREALRQHGHEVDSTADWPSDPGDEEIMRHAHRQGCVLVTLDKDFGELAIARGQPHSGIIRLVSIRAAEQGALAAAALARYGEELLRGAIVTVESSRVRVRSSDAP